MVQVRVSQQGEWIINAVSLKQALGIPANANITGVSLDPVDGSLHVIAVQATSDTGTP